MIVSKIITSLAMSYVLCDAYGLYEDENHECLTIAELNQHINCSTLKEIAMTMWIAAMFLIGLA